MSSSSIARAYVPLLLSSYGSSGDPQTLLLTLISLEGKLKGVPISPGTVQDAVDFTIDEVMRNATKWEHDDAATIVSTVRGANAQQAEEIMTHLGVVAGMTNVLGTNITSAAASALDELRKTPRPAPFEGVGGVTNRLELERLLPPQIPSKTNKVFEYRIDPPRLKPNPNQANPDFANPNRLELRTTRLRDVTRRVAEIVLGAHALASEPEALRVANDLRAEIRDMGLAVSVQALRNTASELLRTEKVLPMEAVSLAITRWTRALEQIAPRSEVRIAFDIPEGEPFALEDFIRHSLSNPHVQSQLRTVIFSGDTKQLQTFRAELRDTGIGITTIRNINSVRTLPIQGVLPVIKDGVGPDSGYPNPLIVQVGLANRAEVRDPNLQISASVLSAVTAVLLAHYVRSPKELHNEHARAEVRAALLKDLFREFGGEENAILTFNGANVLSIHPILLKAYLLEQARAELRKAA